MARTGRDLRAVALIGAAWLTVGLFFGTQDITRNLYLGIPTPWWQTTLAWVLGVSASAALTAPALWLGRRYPIVKARWLGRAALHLGAGVAFALLEIAAVAALMPLVGLLTEPSSFAERYRLIFILSFHGSLVSYGAIIGIQHAFRYYRGFQERAKQALRLESQLARARLGALKMQLQPHFLFNTLNAIMVLVRQGRAAEAEATLARLGDLLRCVLADGEAQEVTLRRELEYLGLYLGIEQLRFQDRLTVDIQADPEVLDAAVPHMGLAPIVENAVRHGITRSAEAGTIAIRAARVGDRLELRVSDDAVDTAAADATPGLGIGLANTRARLAELYGAAAELAVTPGAERGTVVTLVLPFRTLEPDGVVDPDRR